jgi:archaellum component FlaF (FlaF/FlaG flagellin family)
MKKKFEIINALMSVVILFAILFQSVHSYEHLVKHLSEKKCLHKRVSSQEITHQHHNSNHCFVCEFGFSTFITSAVFWIHFFIFQTNLQLLQGQSFCTASTAYFYCLNRIKFNFNNKIIQNEKKYYCPSDRVYCFW